METLDVFWWFVIVALFLLAYAGLFLPALPDVPFIFAGFLVYQFLVDDQSLGWFFWTMMIVATVILFLIDYLAGGYAAQKVGGSKWSIPAAALGVILFMWLPAGFLIGPIIMVFLVELLFMRKTPAQAMHISISTLIGFLGGMVVKFFLMSAMIIWFLILVFFF
jgi:uncharacterized protein YqgC (DUF456 family)